MTATVKIDLSDPMAPPLLRYLEKLPFVTVEIEDDKSEAATGTDDN
jgi:hypothetical protein